MLEDLALRYSELPPNDMRVIAYVLAILGGGIGGVTYRSTAEIRRAPYFALTGLIFLCVAVVTFLGAFLIVPAIVGGYFWAVAAAQMLASVIGGFFVARIAADRSRDACGHGRRAALAFIPLANLWLMLTPSKTESSASRAPAMPLLTARTGVLSGIVLLCAGIGLSAYARMEGMRRVDEAAAAGLLDKAMLGRTLAKMAAELQTPLPVDETTTILRMDVAGAELRYVYEVDPPLDALPQAVTIGVLQKNCANKGLTRVIDAGATIRHVYLRKDGTGIGSVEVTKAACGR